MDMIGHYHVSEYAVTGSFKCIKPFINNVVPVGDMEKGNPIIVCEGDEINATIEYVLFIYRHSRIKIALNWGSEQNK